MRRHPALSVVLLSVTLALVSVHAVAQSPPTASEEAAQQAYREGQFSRAAELYTDALLETDDHIHKAELHIRIAWSLFAIQREDEAARHLAAALVEDPNLSTFVPDYYTKEFLDLLEEVRSRPPSGSGDGSTVMPPDMEATIASVIQRIDQNDDLTGAIADLDRLLMSYGFDDRLVQLKIQTLEALGRNDEAQRLRADPRAAVPPATATSPGAEYLTVPDLIVQANRHLENGNLDSSLRLLRDAVARQPSNVAALGLLADAAQRAGNWTEAEYAITSALSFQPNSLELKLQLGEVYLAMDAPSSARDVFRQLADQHPHSDRAWAALGLIDARLQRYDRALEALEKALQENPLLPDVQLAYGELLLKDGRHREAIEPLRAAANQLSDDPQVLARIGQALLALGRPEEALPNLRTAVDKGFDGPDVRRSLILAMIRNHLIAEADRTLESSRLPAGIETDMLRGLLALERNNLESALGFFRQVAQARPNEAAALNLVAVVLYREGRFAEAMPLLEQAVQLAPANPQLATNLELARTALAAAQLGASAISLGS